MLAKLSVARFKTTFVSESEGSTIKQFATGPIEIMGIIVTAGGSAATFRLVDSTNAAAGYSLEDGPAVSARSSESVSPNVTHPLPMKKGCALVCEQGEGSNAECTVWYS